MDLSLNIELLYQIETKNAKEKRIPAHYFEDNMWYFLQIYHISLYLVTYSYNSPPMRIILITSLLFLASCVSTQTPTGNTPPPSTGTEVRTVATPTYGSGRTQVEIFADFQCGACISFNETIHPIFEEYAASGRLMITYRQFPLASHKNAKWDAIAALCAAEQGKYMGYKKWLYAMEKTKAGKLATDADRVTLAKEKGLDEAKFSQCLSSRAYEKQVESDIALWDSKWVSGTPTIYLDGIKVDMSLFRDLAGLRSFLESRMK